MGKGGGRPVRGEAGEVGLGAHCLAFWSLTYQGEET